MLRAKAFKLSSLCGGLCVAVTVTACSPVPLAPSPFIPGVTVTLTIVARDTRTGAALPDVRAYASNLRSCTTKDDGMCRIDVEPGAIVTVAVWGDGYAGTFRTATVSGDTRWTFNMEAE